MHPLFDNEDQGIGVAQQALNEVRGFLRNRLKSASTSGANDKDCALRLQFESLEETLKVVTDSRYARRLAGPGETFQGNHRANIELLRSIVTTAQRMTSTTTTPSPSSDEEDTTATATTSQRACGPSTSGSSTSSTTLGSGLALSNGSSLNVPSVLRRTSALREYRSSLASLEINSERFNGEDALHAAMLRTTRIRLVKERGRSRPLSENPISTPDDQPEKRVEENNLKENVRLTVSSPSSDILVATRDNDRSKLSKRSGKLRESSPDSNLVDVRVDSSLIASGSVARDRRSILQKSSLGADTLLVRTPLLNRSSLYSLPDVPPPVPPKGPLNQSTNENKDNDSTPFLMENLRQFQEHHRFSTIELVARAGPSRVRKHTPIDINPQNDAEPTTTTTISQPIRNRPTVLRPILQRPPARIAPITLRTQPPPSSTVFFHRPTAASGTFTEPKISCMVCGDRFPFSTKHLKTACGHSFCGDCAVNLVEAHNRQESLHPLRCCINKPIPHTLIEPFLSPDQLVRFHGKIREYNTPYPRRVYCPKKGCSQFIKLGKITMYLRRTIKCPSCTSSICLGCREFRQPGHKCKKDDVHTVRFQMLVKDKGWQKCPNCHRIVERTEGCLHMTCLCKFEFCYRCGAKTGSKCGHGLF